MASEVEICNLALSHLGEGKEIQDLETEKTEEATVCRRYYDISRDEALEDFNWPFARRSVALGLIEEDPTSEYRFSYRYPADAVRIRRIFSGVRNDTNQSKVHYVIASDDTSRIIYTDCEDAVIEYTKKITDPNLYSPSFIVALSYKLAGYIAPRIMAGDPFGMINKIASLYEAKVSKAEANALNEQQREPLPRSEFTRTRNT